jgi:hypothetical protein
MCVRVNVHAGPFVRAPTHLALCTQFNFKLPKIPNIRRDMVWWREDVERPLTLELRWLSEPEVDVRCMLHRACIISYAVHA